MAENDIEIEELKAWNYAEYYFWQVLSGEKTLEEARQDILSFRNSKWYTGTQEKYKKIIDE